MATVYERFKKLGLAHSNFVLQECGNWVRNHIACSWEQINKINQREGDNIYMVNDYPKELTHRIDDEIIQWVNHRPSKRVLRQR